MVNEHVKLNMFVEILTFNKFEGLKRFSKTFSKDLKPAEF